MGSKQAAEQEASPRGKHTTMALRCLPQLPGSGGCSGGWAHKAGVHASSPLPLPLYI